MPSKTAELLVTLSLKKEGFDKGVKSTKSNMEDLGKSFLKSTAAIAATGLAIYATGKQIYALGKRGAMVTQTADSFEYLSEKIGLAPDLLEQLQKASKGTISDFKLMSSTATLLAGTSDELGKALGDATPELMNIAKAANKLNPSLGTTSHMYESIALGIKRASPLILDNLGLTIKIGDANETMAESLGKSVEALTGEEKQMALLNATLAAGDKLLAQVGGTTDSAADSFAQMETQLKNLSDEVATKAVPAISRLVDRANELLPPFLDWLEVIPEADQALAAGTITLEEHEVALGMAVHGVEGLALAQDYVKLKTAQYTERMEEANKVTDGWAAGIYDLRLEIDNTDPSIKNAIGNTDNWALAMVGSKGALEELSDVLDGQYQNALKAATSSVYELERAKIVLMIASGQLNGATEEETTANINNALSMLDSINRLEKLTQAVKDGTVAEEDLRLALMDNIVTLDEFNTLMGITAVKADAAEKEVWELRGAISSIPDVTNKYIDFYIRTFGTAPAFPNQPRIPPEPRDIPQPYVPPPAPYVPPSGDGGGGYGFGQHGLSMTVPPGYPNDTFPIFASSGELVNVFTKGQQGKFSAVSTAMSFGGSNVKPQWQDAIEKFAVKIPETVEWTAGEMVTIMGKMERDTLQFSDDIYSVYEYRSAALAAFYGDSSAAMARTVDYSSMSMVELMARMAETMDWFARTAVGYLAQIAAAFRGIQYPSPYQPSPWQPGTYDKQPVWDPATFDKQPTWDAGTYDVNPWQPGTYDVNPWQPSGPYNVNPWQPSTYDVNPWQPGTFDKNQTWESGTYTVNNLNIYTNAPVDSDVPDLLLLRAWSSG